MRLSFNEPHFAEFQRRAEADLPWRGEIPASWARVLLPGVNGLTLPENEQTRAELRAYCQNPEVSDGAAFIACMAWGKMRRNHFRSAWAARSRLMPLLRMLRESNLSRDDAYHLFQSNPVPHIGPAYYTKLIFFLRPIADGYIMDQWTGKSISLVFTPMFIRIQGKWVTSANTADVYARYCKAVEVLAEAIGRPGDVTEQMLFSQGQLNRQPRHPWRDYVHRMWSRPERLTRPDLQQQQHC